MEGAQKRVLHLLLGKGWREARFWGRTLSSVHSQRNRFTGPFYPGAVPVQRNGDCCRIDDRLGHLYCSGGHEPEPGFAGAADSGVPGDDGMTIIGALSYGELAAMMPKAGGQYVYL